MENKTLKEVLEKYNVSKYDLEFIDEGANGEAYLFIYQNKKYVLKFTNKQAEWDFALTIIENQKNKNQNTIWNNSVEIYEAGEFLNNNIWSFYIIMEYLIITDDLKNEFDNYINYVHNQDEENYDDKFSWKENFNNILNIQKQLGSRDIHSGNIGFDKYGIIKGFDWDY